MKIAFIKQKYVEFGGGERYLDRLMEACAARGDDVHLITTAWRSSRKLPVDIHIVPRGGLTLAQRVLSFSRSVERFLNSEEFDLSFSLDRTARQDLWRAGEGVHRVWLDRRRHLQPRFKCILDEFNPRHRALLSLEAECVRRTPRIIANSNMVREDLLRVYGEEAKPVDVIRNGVDPDRFRTDGFEENRNRVRAELGLDPERPLLLMVGSGLIRKGLRESLQALARLRDCVLLVLGRDDSRGWKRMAARLGVEDRVIFMPPRRDIVPCCHAADLLLLPSWFDPFPNAGLEALFCGLPVLTSRFAGIYEIVVAGDTGEIIDTPADIDGFVAGIGRQLGIGLDAERRRSISASVSEYTIENNRLRTLSLLRSGVGEQV